MITLFFFFLDSDVFKNNKDRIFTIFGFVNLQIFVFKNLVHIVWMLLME